MSLLFRLSGKIDNTEACSWEGDEFLAFATLLFCMLPLIAKYGALSQRYFLKIKLNSTFDRKRVVLKGFGDKILKYRSDVCVLCTMFR